MQDKFSERRERQAIVELLLEKFGFSSKKIGFLYLSILITLAWQEKETSGQPFQVYGNQIAKEANVFLGHIYANMQYAIEEAWFLGNYKLFESFFGYSLLSLVTTEPTPNKFVHTVVVGLLALERNNANIPAFLQFIEKNGIVLRELSWQWEEMTT